MFFNLQSSSYLPYKLSIYAGHLCGFGLISNKLYNCINYYSQPLHLKSKAIANEYSCAMKSHFRKSGNQMSGKWKSSYASLLA